MAAVESHLASLWTLAGDDGARVTEKGLPHARASVLNLIVTVPDELSADRVVATMLGLGFRHPSRAIVLVAEPRRRRPDWLDASVSAHCHAIHEAEEQVCYEEVVLTVRGEAAAHLDGIVAPLLIHDLPTLVWWPGDPPFADPIFDQLVEMGDRLIIDSSDFSDLLLGLRRLANAAPPQRNRGPGLEASRLVAGADRPVLRRAALPPLPAEPEPGADQVRPAARVGSGPAPDRSMTSGAGRGEPDRPGHAVRVLDRLAPRLEAVQHRPGRWRTGRWGSRWRAATRWSSCGSRACLPRSAPPGDLLSVRLRAHGETGAAEFIIDRDGDEAIVASNADGMTAQLRRVRMELPLESELLATSLVADRHDGVYEAAIRAAAIFLAAARPAEEAG